eukprot:scaffold40419_cov36-Tisochrysis_lutea.AAC.2
MPAIGSVRGASPPIMPKSSADPLRGGAPPRPKASWPTAPKPSSIGGAPPSSGGAPSPSGRAPSSRGRAPPKLAIPSMSPGSASGGAPLMSIAPKSASMPAIEPGTSSGGAPLMSTVPMSPDGIAKASSAGASGCDCIGSMKSSIAPKRDTDLRKVRSIIGVQLSAKHT